LAELDTNGDSVINAQDTQFNELKVWVDTGNSNGSATGVLESLDQLGITQLNLNAKASTQTNNGNLVSLISSYQTTSGMTGTMADVWFATQTTPGLSSTVSTTHANLSVGALSQNQAPTLLAMRQFNANGQPVSTLSHSPSGHVPMNLNLSSLHNPSEIVSATTSLAIPVKKPSS
jgi:hypothetical protein